MGMGNQGMRMKMNSQMGQPPPQFNIPSESFSYCITPQNDAVPRPFLGCPTPLMWGMDKSNK